MRTVLGSRGDFGLTAFATIFGACIGVARVLAGGSAESNGHVGSASGSGNAIWKSSTGDVVTR